MQTEPVHRAGAQTGQRSLGQADYRSEEGIGIPKNTSAGIPSHDTGQQHNYAEHTAQISPGFGTVQSSTNDNGCQSQGDGKGTELDEGGDYLQDYDNGRQ